MAKIGRNDPCPCGSGKKFKKCHEGREDELILEHLEHLPEDAGLKITSLPEVSYGRSREILAGLDLERLTGTKVGIKFVDLKTYLNLGFVGRRPLQNLDNTSAGQMINPLKTALDPGHIYLAISPAISDSTLIHQLSHALDYLVGSKINPGLAGPLSLEIEAPAELLEHTKEFGDWLLFLRNEFAVTLDAEDAVVAYLHETGNLIPGQVLASGDNELIKSRAKRILGFISRNRGEIDRRIKDRAGYLPQAAPSET
ncbi:MAG: SEC-C metal-binding domain-containing protein [Thermodesulfobacteriota bacterium]